MIRSFYNKSPSLDKAIVLLMILKLFSIHALDEFRSTLLLSLPIGETEGSKLERSGQVVSDKVAIIQWSEFVIRY